jgi:hypothetical protein
MGLGRCVDGPLLDVTVDCPDRLAAHLGRPRRPATGRVLLRDGRRRDPRTFR